MRSITFDLGNAGWAKMAINGDTETYQISRISYLGDALDDLLRLGIDIATDRGHGIAQFFHEPGSTILFAEAGWWNETTWVDGVRISGIESTDFGEPEPTWQTLHSKDRLFVVDFASRDALAAAVLAAGDSVYEAWGTDGYSTRWTGRLGFPVRALAALREALRVASLPIPNYSPQA